jgi:hypothetical protein
VTPSPRPGWLALDCETVVHVVPGFPDLTVANDHELNPYCWCHPIRINGPLETPLLSHNDEAWPGSDRNRGTGPN